MNPGGNMLAAALAALLALVSCVNDSGGPGCKLDCPVAKRSCSRCSDGSDAPSCSPLPDACNQHGGLACWYCRE